MHTLHTHTTQHDNEDEWETVEGVADPQVVATPEGVADPEGVAELLGVAQEHLVEIEEADTWVNLNWYCRQVCASFQASSLQ